MPKRKNSKPSPKGKSIAKPKNTGVNKIGPKTPNSKLADGVTSKNNLPEDTVSENIRKKIDPEESSTSKANSTHNTAKFERVCETHPNAGFRHTPSASTYVSNTSTSTSTGNNITVTPANIGNIDTATSMSTCANNTPTLADRHLSSLVNKEQGSNNDLPMADSKLANNLCTIEDLQHFKNGCLFKSNGSAITREETSRRFSDPKYEFQMRHLKNIAACLRHTHSWVHHRLNLYTPCGYTANITDDVRKSLHLLLIESILLMYSCDGDSIKNVFSYFAKSEVCIYLSKTDFMKALASLLELPTDYPPGLLFHYMTCQDPDCNIGPAFTINESFNLEVQEWEREKEYVRSKLMNSEESSLGGDTNGGLLLQLIRKKISDYKHALETAEVKSEIERFMEKLGQHLRDNTNWNDLKLQLVGSTAEGTRSYFPDEYDYVLILFTEGIEGGKCVHYDLTEAHSPLLINILICDKCYKDKISQPLIDALSKFNHQYAEKSWRLHIGNLDKRLDPSSTSYIKLSLHFCGKHYKDLNISIDLVPVICLNLSSSFPLPLHRFIDFNAYRDSVRLCIEMSSEFRHKLDFSHLEVACIKQLPANIRQGYTLAKAMRTRIVLKQLKEPLYEFVVEHVRDISKCIRSYMLKTCLLSLTQHLDPNHESTGYSDVYWAMCIYGQLLKFCCKGCIPHFFVKDDPLVHRHDTNLKGYLVIIGNILKTLRQGNSGNNLKVVSDDFLAVVERLNDSQSNIVDCLKKEIFEPWK